MTTNPVRTSAKAIIFHNNKLLVIKMRGQKNDFYILPGGGQNLNENLHEALKRELLEEVGAKIQIKELVLVREYISNNHEFKEFHPDFHSLNLIFTCDILNFDNLLPITEPDKSQIGIEWLPVDKLLDFKLYPLSLRNNIIDIYNKNNSPVYAGDVN